MLKATSCIAVLVTGEEFLSQSQQQTVQAERLYPEQPLGRVSLRARVHGSGRCSSRSIPIRSRLKDGVNASGRC